MRQHELARLSKVRRFAVTRDESASRNIAKLPELLSRR
jgi:hypothetical protein